MKLPSIRHLFEQFTKTFLRFPFALTSACVGTGAWLILIHEGDFSEIHILQNLTLVTMLGISLFTAISLLCERLKTGARTSLLAHTGGVVLLAAYFFILPDNIPDGPSAHVIRYMLFAAGLHFFVAVGPFFRRGEINGFWQFNKSLFLRVLTSGLYSFVLFLGLAAAILAVDHLFEVNINGKRYLELWVFIVGIFNTWFFLAGVPENLDNLDADREYPKGLKIFTQYVLLPLVSIYLVILYAYTVKILVAWDWPKGWVGYLVLGFSILGILSLLLVHPIKERTENKWIRTISKGYYAALIPLVILLLMAIWRRTSEYGLTERRYFVFVLGFWLAAMIGYFLLSKSKSIKIIPSTLCVIAFLTSFGPWGAMGLSESNQLGRLREVLTRTGVLKGEKIQSAGQKLSFEDCRRVSGVVSYLNEVHGLRHIQPWFDANLDTLGGGPAPHERNNRQYNRPRLVVELMGVTYVDQWQTAAMKTLSFQSARTPFVDIRGYDYLFPDFAVATYDTVKTMNWGPTPWKLVYSPSALTIRFTGQNKEGAIEFDLRPMISKLEESYGTVAYASEIPTGRMSLEQNNGDLNVNLHFDTVMMERNADRKKGGFLQVDIMIGRLRK